MCRCLLHIDRPANRPTTQSINNSVAQSSINKVTLKTYRPVIKSVKNFSLKSSMSLITNSPHRHFVQSAFRIITSSHKSEIAISLNNPFTKSHTLQFPSEPNRLITHSKIYHSPIYSITLSESYKLKLSTNIAITKSPTHSNTFSSKHSVHSNV